eukprot:1351926-Amphidinium_carterae.1
MDAYMRAFCLKSSSPHCKVHDFGAAPPRHCFRMHTYGHDTLSRKMYIVNQTLVFRYLSLHNLCSHNVIAIETETSQTQQSSQARGATLLKH